jgi:hypothetical protein
MKHADGLMASLMFAATAAFLTAKNSPEVLLRFGR